MAIMNNSQENKLFATFKLYIAKLTTKDNVEFIPTAVSVKILFLHVFQLSLLQDYKQFAISVYSII